jgi:hypothetical protein
MKMGDKERRKQATSEAAAGAEDMLPDYSGLLANGVRGKYVGRLRRRANLAVLAPDVAAAFPTDQAVNEALRSLMASTDKG